MTRFAGFYYYQLVTSGKKQTNRKMLHCYFKVKNPLDLHKARNNPTKRVSITACNYLITAIACDDHNIHRKITVNKTATGFQSEIPFFIKTHLLVI
jgi:hypothetical protein